MASSSEVQAPRISAAAPRTTADPPIPGAPRPEPNDAVRATQIGHVASRTATPPNVSEEDNYSEEEDYSEEEGSGPEEGTERDDWLLARIRSLEELDAELERAEEKRALVLEKERITAQELSCEELKLEAMRAESSSDGGSKNLVSSTAEEVHMPRDVVPYLKEGVNTRLEVQGYCQSHQILGVRARSQHFHKKTAPIL
ncbi:hypothetical protein NDU88_003275 [Pleurodeles waltl]|uniref:Uncharacterized protein n=1 Tax=Pleurodeles waltl TaxID=8319 RepID=A0AAV7NG61_PLEWA|nr:hypothetical protein NDU88_003275 [Pleurodeles waltl]